MIKKLFKSRSFRVLSFVILAGLSFGALALHPQTASADSCTPNGRDCYFGYFNNGYDGGPAANGTRWNVLSAPALINVDNADDLINEIDGYLSGCSNLNSQNQTGAAFIILTMLGAAPGTNKNQACARFSEWAQMIHDYDDANAVDFDIIYDFQCINTRSTLTDVAWYPSCGAASSIVFYNPDTGDPMYAIKKDCANPVGHITALALDFDLQADIVATVNGSTSTSVAEAGDTIGFSFRIINNGTTNSSNVNCDAHVRDHAGFYNNSGPPEPGGASVGTSCPRTFPGGSTTQVASQSIIAPANTTVCRTLFVEPATVSGGRRGRQVCVPVASKPYLKVFGGDVSAGGGFETAPSTCGADATAQITSWNKRDASFSGSGTQYAAFALNTINDFATAQRSTGTAQQPTGLSFANTSTNTANGIFGGNLGSAKCVKDYYGRLAKIPTAEVKTVSDMASTPKGTFKATGNTTLGALTLPAGTNWTLYVDGDLQINGNITYANNWDVNNIPMFQVVVRGNIYVNGAVSALQGTYIAQPRSDGTKGTLYTCASSFAAPSITNGSFYNGCTTKLTVTGSFVAKDIEFLRTRGTLRQATAGEGASASGAAEEFLYGPSSWIMQPQGTTTSGGSSDNYDSITSLPPIL